MPTEMRHATPKARKPHECSLCLGPISPGETYSKTTYVYDGRVYDWRTCAACLADKVSTAVFDWTEWDEDGIGPDDALEWAEENWRQDPAALRLLIRGHKDPREA